MNISPSANPDSDPADLYPVMYPLCVIGYEAEDLVPFIVAIVQRHVPDLDLETVTSQNSSAGKYRSVKMTFLAPNRALVEAIYQELRSQARIVTVL
jgi:putative lipoic acid-binding regulatory protein